MSYKSKSSSSHESEDSDNESKGRKTGRKTKLGAQFFIDVNADNCDNADSTTNRQKIPAFQSTSIPGVNKSCTTTTKSRSRAASWPSEPETDEKERNNNIFRPTISSSKNEIPGNSNGSSRQNTTAQDQMIATVTEQLQIIQETQELILTELRSDIESLQTENLCLQHNNSRLRIQVDHLNDLVYELSKELNLVREFVNARKKYSAEDSTNAPTFVNLHMPDSFAMTGERESATATTTSKKEGENAGTTTESTDSCKVVTSTRSRSKGHRKSKRHSSRKNEKKHAGKSGFFAWMFRSRPSSSSSGSSRTSRSRQHHQH